MAQPYVSLRRLTTFVTSLADTVNAKISTSAIKNNDSTTDSGYVADARIVKTHGDEIDKHTTQLGGLYFGTDDDGAWGYATTSAGDVTPFRHPTGNATQAQVLSGYVFSNATADDYSGTMNNWGANTVTLSSSNTASLSAGYYSSVSINAAGRYSAGYNAGYNANTNSGYSSGYSAAMVGNATAARVLSGYTFTNASTVGATGTMNNWGSNTITLSSSNTATRSAGYYSSISVNAAGLYKTAYNAGYNSASLSRTSLGSVTVNSTSSTTASWSATSVSGYSSMTVTNFGVIPTYLGAQAHIANNYDSSVYTAYPSMSYTASSGTLTMSGAVAGNYSSSTWYIECLIHYTAYCWYVS